MEVMGKGGGTVQQGYEENMNRFGLRGPFLHYFGSIVDEQFGGD